MPGVAILPQSAGYGVVLGVRTAHKASMFPTYTGNTDRLLLFSLYDSYLMATESIHLSQDYQC